MDFKIKLRLPDIKSTALYLIIAVFFSVLIQGCNKEEYDPVERDEIVNSIEFEEYIAANTELVLALQKVQSLKKNEIKKAVTPNGINYRTCPFKIDQNLLLNVSIKQAAFLKKHPSFQNYRKDNRKELIEQTLSKSKTINKLLQTNGVNLKEQNLIRLKSGSTESGNLINSNSGFVNALNYAMDWSIQQGVEISGYLFAGGGAVIYLSPNATETTTKYPGPIYTLCDDGSHEITIYNNQVVAATFHTHPSSGSGRFSNVDYRTQSNYFPNCDLYILNNCDIYQYHFENGFYIP